MTDRRESRQAEYMSCHFPADALFAKAMASFVTRRTGSAGREIAWIATESTTEGTYKDKPINSMSKETIVLGRDRGAWRIVHNHWPSRSAN